MMHMGGTDPNKMFNRLSKRQKHIILIWLHSNWLRPNTQEKVKKIYELGMYNQGDEKELLKQLREKWISIHKKNLKK